MTRADKLALIASLVGLIALYWLLWSDSGPADQVTVAARGKTRVLSLGEDQRIAIAGRQGSSIIEINHGRARFVASPCSGKICIHTGWLTSAGDTAACVPNGVILSVVGADSRFDSINF